MHTKGCVPLSCEALTRKTRRVQASLTSLNSVSKTRIREEVPGWCYFASCLSWRGRGGESTKNPGSMETWSLAPSFHWIVLVVQDSLPHPVSPAACLLCQAECFTFSFQKKKNWNCRQGERVSTLYIWMPSELGCRSNIWKLRRCVEGAVPAALGWVLQFSERGGQVVEEASSEHAQCGVHNRWSCFVPSLTFQPSAQWDRVCCLIV